MTIHRLIGCAALAALLTACGGAGSSVSSAIPATNAAAAAPSGVVEALTGEATANASPSVSAVVQSAFGEFLIGGKKYYSTINGTCTLTLVSGTSKVNGCAIYAGTTTTIQKSVIGLFSKPHAKGCLLAEGKYSGPVTKGQKIPVQFYAEKNACVTW